MSELRSDLHDPASTGVRSPSPGQVRDGLAEVAAAAGLRRVHLVAWRDLDDPEAGGSEIHADRVATRWADAGLDVTLRTSHAEGQAPSVRRGGYRVDRRGGRYQVFPSAAIEGWFRRDRDAGLVEIWNGMPFFSPLWSGGPRMVFLHHVHDEMWNLALSPGLARVGRFVERRLAPPLYHGTPIVTLSESSRRAIVDRLGLPAEHVTVVSPGVDGRFTVSRSRSAHPLVVAVGRLVPAKQFPLLVAVLGRLRARHPHLEAVIAGEGWGRAEVETAVDARDARSWLHVVGRLGDDEIVRLYQRAWVVASTSTHEGWGMTLTEAAACGTPAVATAISGHRDAVLDGQTGLLAAGVDAFESALDQVLSDSVLRRRLGHAARIRARELTWDATALGTLRILAADAGSDRGPRAGSARPTRFGGANRRGNGHPTDVSGGTG